MSRDGKERGTSRHKKGADSYQVSGARALPNQRHVAQQATRRTAPVGRPPAEHAFADGGRVRMATGKPYNPKANATAIRTEKLARMRRAYSGARRQAETTRPARGQKQCAEAEAIIVERRLRCRDGAHPKNPSQPLRT